MMNLTTLYYQRLLSLILNEYKDEFVNAKAGHCMKITGLALAELQQLCKEANTQFTNLKTFILSDNHHGDMFISATKLIELRNDLSFPLLVLIPSNSRTSAEDSYGNATFKNLPIQHLDERLLADLKKEIPASVKNSIVEIIEYLKLQKLRPIQYINFLLDIQSNDWSELSIGKALHHLTLIPDSILAQNYSNIRQRLLYNLKCIDFLGDFSHTIPKRIADLPITPKTIQKEIVDFLRAENHLKNKSEICEVIAQKYHHLDFSKWPVLDIEANYDLQITFEKFTSKDLKTNEGDFTFTIPSGKSIRIKIILSTKPSPRDFKELKNFHIVLMAIDGWSQVLDIKKTKVTESNRNERTLSIDLSENLVEEGSYFFRVFGEDENGAPLNTNNAFKDSNTEEEWKRKQKENPLLTRDEFQFLNQQKYTSDSDDFYIKIGETEESDGENFQRKDKLNNVLEAYFRFRTEALRKDNPLLIPTPIDESGVWLAETQSALVGTYHIKYSSSHNYQINVSNKLQRLEKCFIKHCNSLGSIEAILGNNPLEPVFQSLRFNSFSGNDLVSQKLLDLRNDLFLLIAKSAPNNEGVFETFDLFNHIDLVKDYISEYQSWTSILNERFQQKDFTKDEHWVDVQSLLIELQNLDMITIQTKLPDGQNVAIKLISPLHPLRLAWFINLFDLYSNWEDRTLHTPSYKSAWYKNLENLFLGDLLPEISMPVLADSSTFEFYQYIGELTYGWGIYAKPFYQEKNALSSVSRQLKTFVSSLLNIANEYRIDTDVNQILIGRHIQNYLIQHPYTEKLIINLFNAGDAYVFTNAFIDLEKLNEFKGLKYELRLFADDTIVEQGEALKSLINPETIISEDAEAFSQASGNRLFPKLRFSIKQISDFIKKPSDYFAHISFLISPFPVKTSLVRPIENKKSFFFNGLINKQIISVLQKNSSITWSKYFVAANNPTGNFSNTSIALFDNIQSYVAHSLSANRDQSVPATCLELSETEKVLLSFIHDVSDWVITFDKNMGPEVYDLPGKEGEIPFLLDYVPGREIYGISSYLTTRPTAEVIGLLGPHFAEYNIDIRNDEEKLKILLEDLRTISSSLIMQFNSSENKAFEVLGTAFTKRVLEKKKILNDAFLIPIDLHKELFENLPQVNKSRADNLLVKINPEKKEISITIIEIKCRTSLNESERAELVEKMQCQIENTMEALRYHFDPTYNISADRLDRELKTMELKSLLEFYLNRANRYNYLNSEIHFAYQNFLDNIDNSYSLQFKRLGIIFNFSSPVRHKKEIYDKDATIFTFGGGLISEILDPNSDLNTQRLEKVAEDEEFVVFFEKKDISPYIKQLLDQKRNLHDYENEEYEKIPILLNEEKISTLLSEHSEKEENIIVSENTKHADNQKDFNETPYESVPLERKNDISNIASLDSLNITLGRNAKNGKDVFFNPTTLSPKKLANQHLLIVGKSGAGKSQTTSGLLYELSMQNIPFLLLDFQGEYVSNILTNSSNKSFLEATNAIAFDPSYGMDINPLELSIDGNNGSKVGYMSNVYQVSNILKQIFGLGDIQHPVLKDAIKRAYLEKGFSVTDRTTWNNEPPKFQDIWEILEFMEQNEGTNVRSLKYRIEPLFENNIFVSGDNSVSMAEIFKQNSIINLATLHTSELMKSVARFVLQAVYNRMLSEGPSKVLKLYVVIDEAHKLSYDQTLTDLIREARKYGIGFILASQSVRDFATVVFENMGTKIALQLEGEDAKFMADNFGATDKASKDAVLSILPGQKPMRALIRNNHYEPFAQVDISPFYEK